MFTETGQMTLSGRLFQMVGPATVLVLVLGTKRALTVLVSLPPINTKCSGDADARDQ